MAEQSRNERMELVLAQNQHAFIQDETKGVVQVIVGPYKTGLTVSDRPVKYVNGKFSVVALEDAISQNPMVEEGSYLILENPAKNSEKSSPGTGSQAPEQLQIGRKINIPGPASFALWPGQAATAVQGHQLKSNEYIVIRVYNVDEAKKNWPKNLVPPKEMVIGQLIVVKGTEVSFFIPPTGLEVVNDPITKNQFVRQAITLERLEYCILLDEDGNKRYERGPQVVFPKATEKFITKKPDSATGTGEEAEGNPNRSSVKFKAIELNDQMGLYIKVIADYEEQVGERKLKKGEESTSAPENHRWDGDKLMRMYKTGDELFITGKDQRIYYPRPEHAIIEYGSEDGKFKRQRYYGIAIPKGEARYVLDKNTGKVEVKRGEMIFLPDPRHQVIVRRVLDQKTVALWYPGNTEAALYNKSLESLAETSLNYVQDMAYNSAVDLARSMNRGLRGSSAFAAGTASAGVIGDVMKRGTQFTPPPSIALNTKYDGPPTINVWTGYAVQVVDKYGNRKIVKGPATVLLEYDEYLEKILLSTGNPKTTDNLLHDVYLRVDHNKVSDTISVETKDMVWVDVKVSYCVNFEGDRNKWFSVENYVKFLCDHCRSLVRAVIKTKSIKELVDNSSSIIRDTILGVKGDKDKPRPGRPFDENGMRIYDVEVLSTSIKDNAVSKMLSESQQNAVRNSLELTAKQQEFEISSQIQKISQDIIKLNSDTELLNIQEVRRRDAARHEAALATQTETADISKKVATTAFEVAKLESQRSTEILGRRKEEDTHVLEVAKQETEMFMRRMGSIDPKLTSAIQSLADKGLLVELAQAVAPLAVMEQQGVEVILKRLFQGTTFGDKINALLPSNKE